MPVVFASVSRFLVSLSLLFAMATIGFAHTGFSKIPTPEMAAYLAAGGSLTDICGGAEDQDGTSRQTCEACLLLSAALMPHNTLGRALDLSEKTRILSFVAKLLLQSQGLDSARLSRAPPAA